MPIQLGNPPLFPAFVAQHTVSFDVEDPTDWGLQYPEVALPASLGKAVRKRQAEFLAGRLCAREALRVLGCPDAHQPIATGAHREPLWPPGIVGSITHTQQFASAAMARSTHARSIGIDAERIVSEEQAQRLTQQVVGPGELERLSSQTGWSQALVFTLVFSAKETIFKCLFPEVGRYFDFHDAAVTGIDAAAGRYSARLLRTLTPAFASGFPLQGTFFREATAICTAMVLSR